MRCHFFAFVICDVSSLTSTMYDTIMWYLQSVMSIPWHLYMWCPFFDIYNIKYNSETSDVYLPYIISRFFLWLSAVFTCVCMSKPANYVLTFHMFMDLKLNCPGLPCRPILKWLPGKMSWESDGWQCNTDHISHQVPIDLKKYGC